MMYLGVALEGGQTSFISALTGYTNKHEHGVTCKAYVKESRAQPASLDDFKVVDTLSLEEAIISFKHSTELPSVENCICILQKCRERRDLGLAKRLHMNICGKGLEVLSVLGDHLVPMFVECESFSDAEQLFYILGHPNECSWTAIIQGCIEEGRPELALYWFKVMLENGVCPSKFTLVALLRACTQLKFLDKGEEVYLEIIKEGFERDSFVGTTVMVMYAKCGLLLEAHEVFETLSVRDVVTWNVLITGYIEYGHDEEALRSLEHMRLEGISPNDVTFLWILKACGDWEVIDDGRKLHAEIIKLGFDASPFIGNTLTDMYAKCGLFMEAWQVFDKMPVHDVIGWTAMVSGYAEAGLGEEALDCLEGMKNEGVVPDVVASVCGLKACAILGDIKIGQTLHADIVIKEFEEGPFVANTLIDVYAKCGLFADALMVLVDMLTTDVVSWNALIAGFAEHELCEDGLKCLTQMQVEGVSPDAVSYICSLNACRSAENIEKARELHSEICKRGFERMSSVCIALLENYVRHGSAAEAQKVFDKLPALDTFAWNSVIALYVEHGQGVEGLRCLEKMELQGVQPDDVTYVCSVKACSLIGAKNMGRELHSELLVEGYERIVFVGNCLVDMYAKFGFLTEAQEIFDELFVRDVVSWKILMASYVEHGLGEEAVSIAERMISESVPLNTVAYCSILKALISIGAVHRGLEIHTDIILEGLERELSLGNTLVDMYAKCGLLVEAQEVFDELVCRDVVTWNSLIAGYAEHGFGQQVLKCLELMKLEGVSPDNVTFLSHIKACGILVDLDQGRELHDKIIKQGLDEDALIGNTLLDMYLKCNSLDEAHHIFYMLSAVDIVAWNILIRGFAEHGFTKGAVDCMKEMDSEAISPNAVTFVSILKACGKQGIIDIGRRLHTQILKEGFETDPFVCTALLDFYFKCGLPAEAQNLFDELLHPSVISWNILIAGYTENGFAEEALNCLEQMHFEGLDPDGITYLCSLGACSITGALDRGYHIYAAVIAEGFDRDPFIGNALVNMYAKCGALVESRAVFDELLVQDTVSWNSLIAGYADEHGLYALICLEEMQLEDLPQDVITYVCSLKACGMVEALIKGQELHECIIKKGLDADSFAGNALVDMYAKCGALAEARRVFDELPMKDTRSWNALLSGLVDYGHIEEFYECLAEMKTQGVQPDSFTLVFSLMICGGLGALNQGRQVHAELVIIGLEKHLCIGNSLIDMYGKCGSLLEAENAFNELLDRDVVSWTSLLAGYAEHGLTREALRCLKEMQINGVRPNVVSWNAAIMCCAEQKEVEVAFKLFAEMQEQCVLPSNVTFMSILKACCSPEALVTGQVVHARIHRAMWLEPIEARMMITSILRMYGQCSSMVDAQQLFDELPCRCIASWNALIAGYVLQGESEIVFNLFDTMKKEGHCPDDITFLSMLTVCKQKGFLSKGQYYYASMSKEYDIAPNINHHRCMLDLLGQAGQLNQAVIMLESMPAESCLVLWSSVLHACKKFGDTQLEKRALEKVAGR